MWLRLFQYDFVVQQDKSFAVYMGEEVTLLGMFVRKATEDRKIFAVHKKLEYY